MATAEYEHEPTTGNVVWVITTTTATCNSAILTGSVTRVRITVLDDAGSPALTTKTTKYDVTLEGEAGTVEFDEADIFDTVNAATLEYFARLGGGSPII